MEDSQTLDQRTETAPLWRAITLGGRIRRRAALLALGTAGALAGVVLGWNRLAAAGLAPIQ